MTQLLFKNDIEEEDATPSAADPDHATSTQDPFAGMRGMWEGRDIDDRQLREKAWGAAKRRKNNVLPSPITSLFPNKASS